MKIARMLYPVKSLGPGRRLVIWTAGCSKHCVGCMSETLQNPASGTDISVNKLTDIVTKAANKHSIDGITISGGDPLEQFCELIEFMENIHPIINDILVFTGYTEKEIDTIFLPEQVKKLKSLVTVLVDGRFDQEHPDSNPLRGSSNQNIIINDRNYKSVYEEYCTMPHNVETRIIGDEILLVGIPKIIKEEDQ